jgi:predicted peptidase
VCSSVFTPAVHYWSEHVVQCVQVCSFQQCTTGVNALYSVFIPRVQYWSECIVQCFQACSFQQCSTGVNVLYSVFKCVHSSSVLLECTHCTVCSSMFIPTVQYWSERVVQCFQACSFQQCSTGVNVLYSVFKCVHSISAVLE